MKTPITALVTDSSDSLGAGGAAMIVFAVLLLLGLYFMPSIIAITRGVNLAYVLCINLFFGWTFFGWLAAFISACATKIYFEPTVIQVIAPTVPAAGWFPNPHGGGGLRYWDGFAWTEHVA